MHNYHLSAGGVPPLKGSQGANAPRSEVEILYSDFSVLRLLNREAASTIDKPGEGEP